MKIDLSDKIALVTGGSRGIGRACCRSLSKAGAKVLINYNRSKEKAEALKNDIEGEGREADIFQADISQPEEVEALFQIIRKKYEKLDILVNNAGIIKDNLLLAMSISDWDRVLNVNLRGAFMCSKYASEMMITRHFGKIINISSVGAIQVVRGQGNYAAAKGGLLSFTRTCAVELAGKGIQVNAVLPGFIETKMTQRTRKRAGQQILDRIPQERFGQAADVADLVVFLASDKSDYITGQAITVDGGLSLS